MVEKRSASQQSYVSLGSRADVYSNGIDSNPRCLHSLNGHDPPRAVPMDFTATHPKETCCSWREHDSLPIPIPCLVRNSDHR